MTGGGLTVGGAAYTGGAREWGRLSAEAGMPLEVWIIFMALVVVAVVVLPRILPPTGPTCTRCEGSGQRQRALARPLETRRLARAEREVPEVRREGAAASLTG